MGDPNGFAQAFATQYYETFDKNRPGLEMFYHSGQLLSAIPTSKPHTLFISFFKSHTNSEEQSTLSFEGATLTGKQAISEKLQSLPFKTVQHAITTIDAQVTLDQGVVVLVTGQLQADQDPKIPFSQTFYLKQRGDSFFIDNDIFRLGVHNF